MRRKESSPVKTGHEKVSVFKGFCGWLERLPTGQRPVMLHTHEVTGSSPVVSTNKKTCFVYLTKQVFLNDVCLRQMMLALPMMFPAEMMSLR